MRRYVGPSEKYVRVYLYRNDNITKKEDWVAVFPKSTKIFATEREAAIAVDKELINRGKPPVNILKPLKKKK